MKRIETRAPRNLKNNGDNREVLQRAPVRLALETILVPTDFSEESKKALRYAVRFAEQFGAGITLLRVFEPVTYSADMGYLPVAMRMHLDSVRNSATERLDAFARELQPPVQSTSLVRSGN